MDGFPAHDSDRGLRGRELFFIFLFWTLLAALSSANRLLDPRGFGFRFSPAAPITFAFVEAWVWAAVTPLIFWLSTRFSSGSRAWVVRLLLLLIAVIAIGIGVYLVLGVAREAIFPIPPRRGGSTFAPLRDIGRLRFLNQLLLSFAILAAGFAREFFLRDQARQREAARLQAQLARARLDALRMQIKPHFLFNTLHAISALVERDPAGVRRMIARLSELLRHTIDFEGSEEVTLATELGFLQRYIEIMEIRFQGRLQVDTSVQPETAGALVPTLILQPIVENALEHGTGRVAGGGRVEIAARRDGDRLVITVRDNGPGPSGPERSGGVGLANTRERLEQFYGGRGSLDLESAPEGGALATMILPFRLSPEALDG